MNLSVLKNERCERNSSHEGQKFGSNAPSATDYEGRDFLCTLLSRAHIDMHTYTRRRAGVAAKESSRSRYEIASECRLSGSDKSGTSATVYLAIAPSRSWVRSLQIKNDNGEQRSFSLSPSSRQNAVFHTDFRTVVPKKKICGGLDETMKTAESYGMWICYVTNRNYAKHLGEALRFVFWNWKLTELA